MQTLIESPDTTGLSPIVLTLEAKATAMAHVISDDSYEIAFAFLRNVKGAKKRIMDAFSPAVTAAFKAHKEMTALRGTLTRPLDAVEAKVKGGLAKFQMVREQERRAKEAELRDKARREEEDRRVAEAARLEDAGDHEQARQLIEAPPVEPGISAPSTVPKVEGASTRMVWKHRVYDASLVSREFLMVDEKKLAGYARSMGAAASVPGVRFYEEPQVAVRV